jgi:protein MAK16
MQHDDLIWRSVDQGFCSFKVKTVKQNFCRNKYNLTGLCSRGGCPLANSRYATIVESEDVIYLFIKTAERAHSPRNLWQKIKLSSNYRTALAQIDKHLEYWPEFYIHKAKQRLTKMVQYHIRKRRIALRTKTRLVGIKKTVERREKKREAKAVAAAKLDKAIEKELLERLRSGAYGDIYNFPQEQYEKVLEGEAELDADDESDDEFEVDVDGDEFEAEYEEEESEAESDIEREGAADGVRNAPDYDFDDDSDDDVDAGEYDEDDSGNPEDGVDEDPRRAKSVDALAYVRARAKRREAGGDNPAQIGKGKKGRVLRKPLDTGGVQVEAEYEVEKEPGEMQRR